MEYDGSKLITFIDACGIAGAVADIMKVDDSTDDRCEVYIRISLPADNDGKLVSRFWFSSVTVCGQLLSPEWGEQLKPAFRTKRGVASGSTWNEAFDGAQAQIMEELLKLRNAVSEKESSCGSKRITAKDFDRVFIHRVNLDHEFALPLVEHNLLPLGKAWSPDCVALLNAGMRSAHRSIRDVDIQQLKNGVLDYKGALTPGAGFAIMMNSMLKAGMKLCVGAINPRPVTESEIEYIRNKSEIELKFEEGRRQIAPTAVSRLNCLFVSDDIETTEGMFNCITPILKVRIAKGSWVTRADIRWFDDYCTAHKQGDVSYCNECIKNYWESRPYDDNVERWEYMVDGRNDVVEGLEDLRAALEEHEI